MADSKGPVMSANKLAMSKALGAAFLNHQVEQLEQKVTSNGNWRGRRFPTTPEHPRDFGNKRRGAAPGVKSNRNVSGSEPVISEDSKGRQGRRDEQKGEKDADIVVVDASVLVHAIPQIKKWCRDGRQEILIIPLEALNTLDLLKKGTSPLAQRARAASRILEAQVGTNPRIRVQRDNAFVPWGEIPFHDGAPANTSPEWVRRTICCARWELEHAAEELKGQVQTPKVVLAVLASSSDTQSDGTANPTTELSASPIPLPAPQPNKFEPRSFGTLVVQWATKAGLEVLEISPASLSAAQDNHGRRSGEYGRNSPDIDRGGRGPTGTGRRSAPFHHQGKGPTTSSGGLVERPPAVMAMMEMVSQPSRVVRVLARGEKLDPN